MSMSLEVPTTGGVRSATVMLPRVKGPAGDCVIVSGSGPLSGSKLPSFTLAVRAWHTPGLVLTRTLLQRATGARFGGHGVYVSAAARTPAFPDPPAMRTR